MIDRIQQKIHITNVTTPTGGMVAVVGGLTLTQWLAIGGFALALGSFAVNFYFQYKRDKREEELHKRKLSQ